MGICISNPLPVELDQNDIKDEKTKQSQDEGKKDQKIDENDAAVKIQSGIRGKKAKLELQKKKEELEQDKPKDWTEQKENIQEPQLPQIFKDRVNYKSTNEDRILPPYQGPDGSVYKGQWNKGEANGFGQMLKKDGLYLKGLWKCNVFSEGGILYPNGDYYIGTATFGERFYTNGVIYKGETDFGTPHGQGEETHPDGSTHKSYYQNGQRAQQDNSHQNH